MQTIDILAPTKDERIVLFTSIDIGEYFEGINTDTLYYKISTNERYNCIMVKSRLICTMIDSTKVTKLKSIKISYEK